MTNPRPVRCVAVASSFACFVLFPVHVIAQIEEIVVTATGREETAQSVPISVTALGAEDMERQGVTDVSSLVSIVPSLYVNRSNTETGGSTIRLRGVGTTGNNAGLEGSVGVFVDGVYLSRPGVAFSDLVDIERIEVLRGPQGTLFGRNTSAGALDIKTNRPHLDETEARLEFSYGNFNDIVTTAIANVPVVSEQLAVRVAGTYHRRDGLLASVPNSITSNDRDRYLIRGQALWQPTGDVSFRLIADYFEADEECCDAVISEESAFIRGLVASPLGTSLGFTNNGVFDSGSGALRDRDSNPNRVRKNDQNQWGISGELNWDLPFGGLTYIGSYRQWHAIQAGDDDFTSLDLIATRNSPSNVDLVTQELRMQGEVGVLDWLVGGFYSNEQIRARGRLGLGTQFEAYTDLFLGGISGGALSTSFLTGVPSGSNFSLSTIGDNGFGQNGNAYAIFTHNVIDVSEFVGLEAERLRVTGGVRYNYEKKLGRYSRGNPNNPGCDGLISETRAGRGLNFAGAAAGAAVGFICFPFVSTAVPSFNQTFDDSQVTGTASIAFDVTDEVLSYFTYSRGFKSGGFNLDSTAAIQNGLSAASVPANPALDTAAGNFLQEGDASFDSEIVDAYEVGVKSGLFENLMRVNAAFFHYDIEDFQVLEFTGVSFVTDNIKAVRVTGAELELRALPPMIEGLEIGTSLIFTKARYSNAGCGGVASPAAATIAGRVCGLQLTNAPKWTINNSIIYTRPLISGSSLNLPTWMGEGDIMATLSANFQWRDDRRAGTTEGGISAIPGASEPNNSRTQDDSYVLDMRLAVSSEDRRWSFELWGRNITDDRSSSVLFAIPLRTGATGAFLNDPRTFGFTIRTEL